ncbi:hypothetical protein QBC39DRAFT_74861 [Podospora conica]|nr:hypothetical protein QBC39DRAFT_74861 [Schizothecium conicum]
MVADDPGRSKSSTTADPPRIGQVISEPGQHPTRRIITAAKACVIRNVDGVLRLGHFPAKLEGLSHADLVHAYREVIFDVEFESTCLYKSIKKLGRKRFARLPDAVLEAILGQNPRAVLQDVNPLSKKRTWPWGNSKYHMILQELGELYLAPARLALARKTLEGPKKRRRSLQRLTWKPCLSPLRQVTNISDVDKGELMGTFGAKSKARVKPLSSTSGVVGHVKSRPGSHAQSRARFQSHASVEVERLADGHSGVASASTSIAGSRPGGT